MKRTKTLSLKKETLRQLRQGELENIAGAYAYTQTCTCTIYTRDVACQQTAGVRCPTYFCGWDF